MTTEEFTVIQTHTVRGHEIAEQVHALSSLAAVIRHHHERFDGTGYPDGLAGDEIPLLSRVIAVADSYDAMTSNRPYREGRSHEQAVDEILQLRGTQFDPDCVDAFATIFRKLHTGEDSERLAA